MHMSIIFADCQPSRGPADQRFWLSCLQMRSGTTSPDEGLYSYYSIGAEFWWSPHFNSKIILPRYSCGFPQNSPNIMIPGDQIWLADTNWVIFGLVTALWAGLGCIPMPYSIVANSWKSAHSPAGNLPRKSGSPDQMLITLIDKEWPFWLVMGKKNWKSDAFNGITWPLSLQIEWL